MSYSDPQKQAVITIAKCEPRTSTGGKGYYLITDAKGDMYSDWDNQGIKEGQTYAIFYTEQTKDGRTYRTIKGASVVDESPADEPARRESRERQGSIIRQHSQEMALRYFAIREDKEFATSALEEMIEYFEKDATVEEQPF